MADNIKVCPHCGDERVHRSGARWRCGRCFVEFVQPATRIQTTAVSAEQAKAELSGEGIVVDRYLGTNLAGERVESTIVQYVRPASEKYTPDLVIKERHALFFRWLFRERNRREHRWGRDDLRRRGYRAIGTEEDRGKLVRRYVHESELSDTFGGEVSDIENEGD